MMEVNRMTINETLACEYFTNEAEKTKQSILEFVERAENYTDEEFSRILHIELKRFDDCRKMIEYYEL